MKEDQLIELIKEGKSQREIGEILGKGQTTVRYWLERYGLETQNVAHTKRNGPDDPRYVQRECKHHGITEFILEPSRNAYRCRACRSGRVRNDRRALKSELVESLGGKCTHCEYDKSPWAMHFHHRNPANKVANISWLIQQRQYDEARQEATKCDLVCANCHAELEAALWN